MTTTFTDYCDDYIDQHIGLMAQDDLEKDRFVRPANKKALERAKEARNLAKFYGGKALTGTAKQKAWAEEIRNKVLSSNDLSEEEKISLVKIGGLAGTAKFWINNRAVAPANFKVSKILEEKAIITELYNKHEETLLRSKNIQELEAARKEIYDALTKLSVFIGYTFPNCRFYDPLGNLIKGLKFRC